MSFGKLKQVACGLAVFCLAAVMVCGQETEEKPFSQGNCFTRPQFVTPRFIQPNFSKNLKEEPDFEKKDTYRADFVQPQFIKPDFVRAQYVPRQYMGCGGPRVMPTQEGYKVEYRVIDPVSLTAGKADQPAASPAVEKKAELAAVTPKPEAAYYFTPPPKDDNCCGGNVRLPAPASAATPAVAKVKIN